MITCAIFQGPLPLPFRPLPIPKKRNFYTNDLCPKLTSPVRSVPPSENTISLINCPVRHEASRSLFPVLSFLDLSEFAFFHSFIFILFSSSHDAFLESRPSLAGRRASHVSVCFHLLSISSSLPPSFYHFIPLTTFYNVGKRSKLSSDSFPSRYSFSSLCSIFFLFCAIAVILFPEIVCFWFSFYDFHFFCNGYYFLHPCIIFVFVFLLSVWR